MSEKTHLSLYSLGIVTEDKPDGTDIILVTPIEILNIQESGLIKDNLKTYKSELKDINNKVDKVELKSTNIVRAKWIPFGHSNRISAPDVVKNETVILFKYGNVDEFYWTTIFREPSLRRLEKVLYAFSDLPSGIKAFDKSTSYWLEVDTKGKKVHFHTSNNDGEFTPYDIIIDTKSGVFIITDNKDNKIVMDAANSTIIIKSPNIILDGDVTITGSLKVGGSIDTSSITSLGDADVKGFIKGKLSSL